MTKFNLVFDRFFSLISDDMYLEITPEETRRDCLSLLKTSIPMFEFPEAPLDFVERVSPLGEDESYFKADLTLEEINILAFGMVQIWLQRQITTIELIRQKFSGPDFKLSSQANHLKSLQDEFIQVRDEHRRLQMLHSRREVNAQGKYQSTFHELVDRTPKPARGVTP